MIKKSLMILLFCMMAGSASAYDLTVIVNGVEKGKGKVFIGLFKEPGEFPDGLQAAGQYLEGDRESLRVIFTDLPKGEIAIAVFQDENKNEALDTNFLGIPTEKYGFSGKKVFGKPSFSDSKVLVQSEGQRIAIEMD